MLGPHGPTENGSMPAPNGQSTVTGLKWVCVSRLSITYVQE